jgi:hypothetical protein
LNRRHALRSRPRSPNLPRTAASSDTPSAPDTQGSERSMREVQRAGISSVEIFLRPRVSSRTHTARAASKTPPVSSSDLFRGPIGQQGRTVKVSPRAGNPHNKIFIDRASGRMGPRDKPEDDNFLPSEFDRARFHFPRHVWTAPVGHPGRGAAATSAGTQRQKRAKHSIPCTAGALYAGSRTTLGLWPHVSGMTGNDPRNRWRLTPARHPPPSSTSRWCGRLPTCAPLLRGHGSRRRGRRARLGCRRRWRSWRCAGDT